MILKPKDVKWIGFKFLDTNSHTFFYNGTYYKAILPDTKISNSIFNILLTNLFEQGFIPETIPAEFSIEGFSQIYHQKTEFFHLCVSEAPFDAIKNSAILYLNLLSSLLKHNYALIDGHTSNIIFQKNTKPLWCDIGSIVPYSQEVFRSAFDQFIQYFIYPLLVREKSPYLETIARIGLTEGLSHNQFYILTNNTKFYNIIKKISLTPKEIIDTTLDHIDTLNFSYAKTGWSEYDNYPEDINIDIRPVPGKNNREAVITSTLKAIHPKYLVDVGANAGRYSRLAAKLGAHEILSIEPDSVAIAKSWLILQQDVSPIKLLQKGISLTPFKQPGDTAMALALTHHLFFTEKMPFRLIASCLASYTTQHLLTEFMPHGMSGKDKPTELPLDYSLEIFVKQLERHFATVKIIDYPFPPENSPRILILCSKKRAAPLDDGLGNLNRPPV